MIIMYEVIVFSLLFIVGSIGLSVSLLNPFFLFLTPFFLVTSGFYVIARSFYLKKSESPALFITFLFAFLIEVVGVKTGVVFGDYSYGGGLGMKIFDVPPVIGLNWLLLILSSLSIASSLSNSRLIASLISGVLLVFLDVLIEPAAMKFDWWSWKYNVVPFLNYFAWFVIAFVLSMILYSVKRRKKTYLLKAMYFIQLIFFIILYVS